jgi:hypothetical protein
MVAILVALGFREDRHGDHACYQREADETRTRKVVPVGDYDEFDQTLIKPMISESGFTRDQFYGATKVTARKAGVAFFKPCGKCGQQAGTSKSCELCIELQKAAGTT